MIAQADAVALLAVLEARFGAPTGSDAEANTEHGYADGFLDCLRWLAGRGEERGQLKSPDNFRYIFNPGAEVPWNPEPNRRNTPEAVKVLIGLAEKGVLRL